MSVGFSIPCSAARIRRLVGDSQKPDVQLSSLILTCTSRNDCFCREEGAGVVLRINEMTFGSHCTNDKHIGKQSKNTPSHCKNTPGQQISESGVSGLDLGGNVLSVYDWHIFTY